MKIMSRKLRPNAVTVYNLTATTNGVATYQRTLLQLVSLNTNYAKKLLERGVQTTDNASLVLDLRDITTTSGRTFLPYKEWLQQADKTGFFTFGTSQDFFIKGNVADALPSETKQTMSTKYQIFSVSSVNVDGTDENKNTIVTVLGK